MPDAEQFRRRAFASTNAGPVTGPASLPCSPGASYWTMTCFQLKTFGELGSTCRRSHSITDGVPASVAGDSMLRSTMICVTFCGDGAP